MRCKLACTNQDGLLKHYRLRHGRGANWPCIYSDCVCTFRTHGALKIHLTRSHCKTRRREVKCTFFTSDITMHRSRACLEGLPLFLRDTSELFLKCLDTHPEDRRTKGVQVGVLTVFVDDGAPASLQTVNCIAVVLEETIVLKDIPDLPTAFAYLFGLLYALDIEFPRHLRYTFETVQHIFMELKSFCSQRVWSLKTKLLL